jgi:hypothetical protein
MYSTTRILALSLFLACTAAAAHAQDVTFAGIPWGAPADSVVTRMKALGWVYGGAAEHDDHAFIGRDSSIVRAVMHGGRAVGFVAQDAARGAELDVRYRALTDSLHAALGMPIDWRPEVRVWEKGLTVLVVAVGHLPDTGERVIVLEWRGPGWHDEAGRRRPQRFPQQLQPVYTTVKMTSDTRESVDTASLQRRANGTFRARFRIDYLYPRADGDAGYDAVEYGMDFDCAGARTRPVSRTTFLQGRRQLREAQEGLPWSPARAGEESARGLVAVCRIAGVPAAVAASPGPARVFGPAPAGWVLLFDGADERTLANVSSIAPRGSGVYGATVRIEARETRETAWGPSDQTQMDVEMDCGGGRFRVLRVALQYRGRSVRSESVPLGRAAWVPAGENPLLVAVCRIARERGL